ncbi:MAG: hemolysin family protein [Candidatus Desulfofervidaceae bacterium]|nr:hemolysin family protein [Candidatus Desulfofervidaceae bacterium]
MSLTISVITFFILLFFEGFFSGSEIAIVSSDPKYIRGKGAKQVLKYLENPEYFLAVTLLGTNLSVITNTALTTALLLHHFGSAGEVMSIFCLPPILLIFGEVVPKTICRRYANYVAPKLAYGLKIVTVFLSPLVFILANLTKGILKVVGAKNIMEKHPFFTREELRFLIQKNALEINLSPKERKLLARLFTFTETDVKSAMIPLVEVVSIADTATVSEAIKIFSQCHHSRLPVYKERVDNIIGIIHYFDFIKADLQKNIKDYIKPAYFVPETKPVHLLLKEMQQRKQPLAIVVDEYGGAVGIVSIEDLLEEITGEIRDEYEQTPIFFQKLDEGRYLIKARMEIDEINEKLPFTLPKGDYETLNGFILSYLGRIPKTGEKFRYKNITFIIRKAQPQYVEEVEVVL